MAAYTLPQVAVFLPPYWLCMLLNLSCVLPLHAVVQGAYTQLLLQPKQQQGHVPDKQLANLA